MDRKIRIAVLCPSEIARRRFMPALAQVGEAEYAGVGVATYAEFERGPAGSLSGGGSAAERDLVPSDLALARDMQVEWGGEIWRGYGALLADPAVDAVYMPLPPSLHLPWGREALRAGKHLLMEKPFTAGAAGTDELLGLSRERGLAVHENYMFAFHSQVFWIVDKIASGGLGAFRMARIDFGFPFRGGSDFRYNKELGGGALLDCGGYALKFAAMLLGEGARVTAARLDAGRGLDVDLFGSATLESSRGVVQVSFGMDNDYRCSLDVWGSEATLWTGRALTAPAGFEPEVVIRRNGSEERVALPADDSFRKSIEHFVRCVNDPGVAEARRGEIMAQARLVEQVRKLAGWR